MFRPFIFTDYNYGVGYWGVGPDVNVAFDASIGISSKKRDLTTPPRSGWEYRDGTDWILDDTLLFLPGGPGKEL